MRTKIAVMVVGGTAMLGLALNASPASAASWHYAWFDSHTPTTGWSTKNVGIGPGGSAVRFDVQCTGGGTYKIEARKSGIGVTVGGLDNLPCDGRWRSISFSHLNSRYAYYAHVSTHNGKRPLQVAAYWG
ncbi:hypothetical protein ACWCXH_07750 [Kitasatospora sp. NPDC001660]